jgi:hypothetical protein
MGLPFSIGTEVMYAGGRWRVERVLGAEAVLLCSDTDKEVSADPLRIALPGNRELRGSLTSVVDETRYDDAGWAVATRRRDLIVGVANRPRTTADITAVAEALGVTPRRVWALLRQVRVRGEAVANFLPSRHAPRAKRLDRRVEAIIEQSIDQHYAKYTKRCLNSLIGVAARRIDPHRRDLPGSCVPAQAGLVDAARPGQRALAGLGQAGPSRIRSGTGTRSERHPARASTAWHPLEDPRQRAP